MDTLQSLLGRVTLWAGPCQSRLSPSRFPVPFLTISEMLGSEESGVCCGDRAVPFDLVCLGINVKPTLECDITKKYSECDRQL